MVMSCVVHYEQNKKTSKFDAVILTIFSTFTK